MGGVSFYEMKGNHYARLKTSHDVASDPRFNKTYRTGLDFGTASRASKLLRDALAQTVKPFADSRYAGRLTARFVKAVAADSTHECGQRQVSNGGLSFLEGFEFNKHAAFNVGLASPPVVSIDRAAGSVRVAVALSNTLALASAQLVSNIVCVNFKKGIYASHHHTVQLNPGNADGEFIFRAPLNADPNAAIIVTLGVVHTTHEQPNAMAIIAALPAEVPSTRNVRRVHQPQELAPVKKRAKSSFHIPLRKSINSRNSGRQVFQIFPKARENPVRGLLRFL